jgi:hypothetical protein
MSKTINFLFVTRNRSQEVVTLEPSEQTRLGASKMLKLAVCSSNLDSSLPHAWVRLRMTGVNGYRNS